MSNTTNPPTAASLARSARIYRLAAAAWAIAALFNVGTSHSSMSPVYFALSAMFIALGAMKARRAKKLAAEGNHPPNP